jgi:hypothetical protein
MLMSRTSAAQECRTSLRISAVGANPGCRPGRHPGARRPRDSVGGRGPADGSGGATPDRTTAARLAHRLPASVERSAAGDHEMDPSRTPWTAARGAAWPRGAGTGAGAGGGGRCGERGQARAVPPLPVPAAG